ncbi:alpha/beta hydrolase [Streptomyces yaizuensis]|uniref:Esterase n=1 Tax=Streptomyces yaizuensis TaxID=2989713 RepID=A0ABQ5P0E0_9ACTN|nr:alpha/beta hydrolase-fold protein [Streptomyces sp. YSPA8]GLF96074.1 esterase [Streptomyces sp. YSPA8]
MDLTSGSVLATALGAAVALFAATVWLWPRLARRTWRAVTGRIGLLLTTQLAIIVSVGLLANNAFLFYGSWSDLLGREDEPGVVVDHPAGKGGLTVLERRKAPVEGGSRPERGGQIHKVAVAGADSGLTVPAYVYLPPEYFRPEHRDRVFPVTVAMTGYPGTAENLIKGLKYPQTAFAKVRQGRMQPMVLVMLRSTVAPPRDTECVDIPGGPQAETFIGEDLPAAVTAAYRVARDARGWGIIGNSTGGYCALKIAYHHPDRYAAGAGLSAYYRAAEDRTTGDLFHGDQAARNRADLLWSLDRLPQPKGSSFLVTSSRKGEDNLDETVEFIKKVRPPARVSSIILDTGGHNFNTWGREVPPALEWLSGRLHAS